ncbi:DegT/DnrJ/EryC1/StrS family aminotransferase [Bailinhaonella thermotolerans]|uniref:DegT/DnrJ/EryC1/StrS family aminotransferase n=1 Tax=Bailinhaonella thermotolerans TaxID=1070861 RepID=A0A3A4AM71_9ACTN|nr:DegT/DnrJ/EryC1/StrS family aminotransferase [Bailinhaonella thermotolerans]RJL20158.1 DegT/DnrJ/EryC1/StrS family aminotransferase [Bailinhaonella thermotolerans]
MIPLLKVPMSDRAPAAVAEVVGSGFVGQGPLVEEFEAALAAKLANPRVVTVNSGTSGLHLALHLLAGDDDGPDGPGEVLTTPLTMEATNWAILANRLRIRWVDIDPATLNVDLDDLARKITPRTRAVMVVHFAGYPVDLDRLQTILDEAEARVGVRPMVIEDAAHAWRATYRGQPIGGTHGNITVFSFQAVKHLTCGDGGLMVLPSDQLHQRASLLRWFGIRRGADRLRNPPDVPEWGFKFHLTDINAAIGLANLEYAEGVVARHRENAAFYDAALADVPGLELTERAADRESSFWIYPMKVEDREGFIKRMDAAGIMVSNVHERNDLHTCVREYRSALPGLDRIADRIVCVPVGWWVTDEQREFIADTIASGW